MLLRRIRENADEKLLARRFWRRGFEGLSPSFSQRVDLERFENFQIMENSRCHSAYVPDTPLTLAGHGIASRSVAVRNRAVSYCLSPSGNVRLARQHLELRNNRTCRLCGFSRPCIDARWAPTDYVDLLKRRSSSSNCIFKNKICRIRVAHWHPGSKNFLTLVNAGSNAAV